MVKELQVTSIYRYQQKGMPGQEEESVMLFKDLGIEGDIHGTGGDRQISIFAQDTKQWMEVQEVKGLCFSRWKGNLLVDGGTIECLTVGTQWMVGTAILEITVQDKKCFPECERIRKQMPCELSKGCCFAKVVQGGKVSKGDCIEARIENRKRYERQLEIPELGKEGQEKLWSASAVIIGAGGLGIPVMTALAEAGIGKIGIVDGDVVEETNLNRQFFYSPEDIGKKKAHCAGQWVKRFRPDCVVEVWDVFLTETNGRKLIQGYDVVVTAVDNIQMRLLINRLTQEMGIPLVDGAIDGFYGTVTGVLAREDPCLACINPDGKSPRKTAHSLGTTTMIVGALQAQMVIAFLIGIPGKGGHIISYDGLHGSLDEIFILKNKNCKVCGEETPQV
ncbi:MAG: ThiF family adenylyltransferase [Lachnospiraceae bacterium]